MCLRWTHLNSLEQPSHLKAFNPITSAKPLCRERPQGTSHDPAYHTNLFFECGSKNKMKFLRGVCILSSFVFFLCWSKCTYMFTLSLFSHFLSLLTIMNFCLCHSGTSPRKCSPWYVKKFLVLLFPFIPSNTHDTLLHRCTVTYYHFCSLL